MTAPSTFELYRNTWKASKATPEVLLSLQTALLNEIVAFARLRFTVYAELYHGVPGKNIRSRRSTNQPAALLQDSATMSQMGALNILRAMSNWITGRQ